MVLTDADFGRAYLTDGWASRFLVELFRSTTVMFVGYSHDDTVMKYLARALPESDAGRRFILTDEADDNRWSVLWHRTRLLPKARLRPAQCRHPRPRRLCEARSAGLAP